MSHSPDELDQISILSLQLGYLLSFRDQVRQLASDPDLPAWAKAELARLVAEVNRQCASIPGLQSQTS